MTHDEPRRASAINREEFLAENKRLLVHRPDLSAKFTNSISDIATTSAA